MGIDVLAVIGDAAEVMGRDGYTAIPNALIAASGRVNELTLAAAKAAVALNNYRATGKPDYEALTDASDALNAALLPFQSEAKS